MECRKRKKTTNHPHFAMVKLLSLNKREVNTVFGKSTLSNSGKGCFTQCGVGWGKLIFFSFFQIPSFSHIYSLSTFSLSLCILCPPFICMCIFLRNAFGFSLCLTISLFWVMTLWLLLFFYFLHVPVSWEMIQVFQSSIVTLNAH